MVKLSWKQFKTIPFNKRYCDRSADSWVIFSNYSYSCSALYDDYTQLDNGNFKKKKKREKFLKNRLGNLLQYSRIIIKNSDWIQCYFAVQCYRNLSSWLFSIGPVKPFSVIDWDYLKNDWFPFYWILMNFYADNVVLTIFKNKNFRLIGALYMMI